MKTLSIRWWLLMAWLGTAVLGNVLFALADSRQSEDGRQQILAEIRAEVTANVARWSDPVWQTSLRSKLAAWEGAMEIRDARGRDQFHSGIVPPATQPDQVVVLMEGTRLVGTIHLFAPVRDGPWLFTSLLLPLSLLLLPAVLAGWCLERMMLRPLAAMSQAARQIANGDLNFHLPPSRMREVAEVSTAFHAMGDALRLSLERQADLEQERRLFISAIAHDLRTPLFALRGYLEGLTQGVAATPERAAHYLAVCQEQATVLEQRITNLFAYARLEYLEQAPRCEPLDLSLLVHQTIERFRPYLEAKDVAVRLLGAEIPCMLEGDAQLLTRVLENLFDNAVRHTPDGGVIQVRWHKEPGRVYFAVADTGPGIVLADLPHLFTSLSHDQVAPGSRRATRTGGAGLGLTIAQRILLAHGGRLTVTDSAIGGAEFVGWLPCQAGDRVQSEKDPPAQTPDSSG